MTTTETPELPPMLTDRGPCTWCGTSMGECWNPETKRTCCRHCEHGPGININY
jgi:hypothetical protein